MKWKGATVKFFTVLLLVGIAILIAHFAYLQPRELSMTCDRYGWCTGHVIVPPRGEGVEVFSVRFLQNGKLLVRYRSREEGYESILYDRTNIGRPLSAVSEVDFLQDDPATGRRVVIKTDYPSWNDRSGSIRWGFFVP